MELIKLKKAVILDERGKKSKPVNFILLKSESVAVVTQDKKLA